jgi:hypothetical protein
MVSLSVNFVLCPFKIALDLVAVVLLASGSPSDSAAFTAIIRTVRTKLAAITVPDLRDEQRKLTCPVGQGISDKRLPMKPFY